MANFGVATLFEVCGKIALACLLLFLRCCCSSKHSPSWTYSCLLLCATVGERLRWKSATPADHGVARKAGLGIARTTPMRRIRNTTTTTHRSMVLRLFYGSFRTISYPYRCVLLQCSVVLTLRGKSMPAEARSCGYDIYSNSFKLAFGRRAGSRAPARRKTSSRTAG